MDYKSFMSINIRVKIFPEYRIYLTMYVLKHILTVIILSDLNLRINHLSY